MRILFDSKKEYHKTPFGCVRQDEKCTLRIDIPKECNAELVKLCISNEEDFEMKVPFYKEKTENEYDTFATEFSLFKNGLYFYYFSIRTNNGSFDLFKCGDDTNINDGGLWQLTCYIKDYDVPEDFKGRVMYQIFPDRFKKGEGGTTEGKLLPYIIHNDLNDLPIYLPDEKGRHLNNDFFGGNFRGIEEKLPYLKELGVGIIYINPIFFAYSNHRYDTADYKKPDPLLGTEEDFSRLCEKAHMLNIRIILDGVFSHTGSSSIYFDKERVFGNGAFSNPNSPYRDWFSFQEYPNRYTAWWGIDTLPCVDEMNKSYLDYIIFSEGSVISHWIGLGADGFRLDVADELPDEFIAMLKKKLREIKPNSLLIGEVWEDASNKISYGRRRKYFSDSELDSVMNYPFRNGIIDFVMGNIGGKRLAEIIMSIAENYPKPVLDAVMNSLSTHDTARILTCLSGEGGGMSKSEKANFSLKGESLEKAALMEKAAAWLQFTLPGSPCIYYGDEIGMEGFEDPLNRGYFRWNEINQDLLEFYKKLAFIKNQSKALRFGNIRFLDADERYIKFAREHEDEKVYVEVSMKGSLPKTHNAICRFESKDINLIMY